jgi:hypothetical protein
VGLEAFDQSDALGGFFITTAGALDEFVFLALDRGHVGKDELRIYDLDVAERIDGCHGVDDVVIIKTTNDMDDSVDFTDVGEELIAEAFALTGTCHKSCDIDEFDGGRDDFISLGNRPQGFETCVRNLDDADVWIDRAERIIRRLSFARASERIKECAFTHIGETYNTSLKHSGQKKKSGVRSAILKKKS